MKKKVFYSYVCCLLYCLFFMMVCSYDAVAQDTETSQESLRQEVEDDSYYVDVLDRTDKDFFSDFDAVLEEDIETMFEELASTEDIQLEEVEPEMLDEELETETIKEDGILEDTEAGLVKE